jgi:RNA polymerase sigma-54 factor
MQDLRLKIQEELEKNPALEILEDKSTVSLDEVSNRASEEYSVFEETSDSGYSRAAAEEASDLKRKFIEGTLSRPESLQEHLLWQLRLQPIDEEWYRIGALLIRNLDSNGFHIEPPELLVKEEKDRRILESVIKVIQSFEPVGVCTKDFTESLLVQIRNHPDPVPRSDELVESHMVLLEKNKLGAIMKKMKISEEELEGIVAFIKTLDPMPGRNFATETPRYVVPDIMIKEKDGDFVIILNDEEIPVLGISSSFKAILKDKNHGHEKKLNRFINTNLNDARWFMRSIRQRNETLVKTCQAIVEFQRNFFRKGPKYLVPLTLKDIAKEIGVHEATVSRITTNKYIQTEWGIFELKFFFTNSISGPGSSGSRFSKQGVKEVIREIIEKEDRQLTDKAIMEELATRGIQIARRTVSKYRKELDIQSSFRR